ncbi:hypothetical protein AT258_24635 [Bacillus wiedmannii]|uniref:M48 family metallopeptidase n=1 Tax=Bacillus TaxID=1386 RepID=UPI00077AC2F1|nr:SprT family zinc-dependent metalloprotease [Bacillus mobilis]KXY74392.1 hypothetical protein AT258_24635 [Bacillus wiedmannii]
MHYIKFGSQTIEYKLSRSNRRKSVSISVDQHGVKVVAPTAAEHNIIENILHQKGAWIRNQLTSYEEMNQNSLKRKFVSGEKFPYLGRHYRLKVIKISDSLETSFRFHKGQFVAEIHEDVIEDQHRDLLLPLYTEWIMERGNQFSKERMKRFTIKFSHHPNSIKIKDQEQRWGSCTPAGNILLNWRIFLAPASIVDYVLAHELVHLKHMNHSQEYWETLRMLLPDYEAKKEWLRVNGKTLYI